MANENDDYLKVLPAHPAAPRGRDYQSREGPAALSVGKVLPSVAAA